MPRILLVDDDEGFRAALKAGLERLGYESLEVGTGEEALVVARTHLPDAVVLDLSLPDMDGTDVCRSLKNHPETSAVPIIIVTGHGDQEDRIACFEAGVDSFMNKPIRLREIGLRLRVLLSRTSGSSERPSLDVH